MKSPRPVNSDVMLLLIQRWAFPVVVAASVVFTSACDGGISTHGRVLDEEGKPIKGALVTLVSRGVKFEILSDDDGSYDVGVIHAPGKPSGKLTASKDGYQPYEKAFTSRAELGPNVDIVLKRVAMPTPAP